jgi:hypothetical protein
VCVWPDLYAILNVTCIKGLNIALLKRNQICQMWCGFVNLIAGPRGQQNIQRVCSLLFLQSLLRSGCKKETNSFFYVCPFVRKQRYNSHNKAFRDISYLGSVELTNKMRPCNRIYYSTVHWRLNMFRAAYRSSSGALTVFAASGLYNIHNQ